jgi:hypothetical protein
MLDQVMLLEGKGDVTLILEKGEVQLNPRRCRSAGNEPFPKEQRRQACTTGWRFNRCYGFVADVSAG